MADISNVTATELQELLSAAVIASLFPHISLMKALLEKGVLSHDELVEHYQKTLDTTGYPPAMAAFIEPIWVQLRKQIDLPEKQS